MQSFYVEYIELISLSLVTFSRLVTVCSIIICIRQMSKRRKSWYFVYYVCVLSVSLRIIVNYALNEVKQFSR